MNRGKLKSSLRWLWPIAAVLAAALSAEGTYRAVLFAKARLFYPETGKFELYAVGGSVAKGWPFLSPEMSFAGIARDLLDPFGDRKIAVAVVNVLGNSMYFNYLRFRDNAAFRDRSVPGAVLIYTGGNHPPPIGRYLVKAYPLAAFLKEKVLIHSFLLSDLLLDWEAPRGLVPVPDLPAFEFYLRRVVAACLDAGLVPILSTEVANYGGLEPSEDVSAMREAGFIPLLQAGVQNERRGRALAAARYYEDLLRRFPKFKATLYFRLGRCYEALHDDGRARSCYRRACDRDGWIAGVNDVVRRVAKDYRVPLVDAARLFEAQASRGPYSRSLFMDEGHLSTEGQLLLARAFAGELARRFGWPLKPAPVDPQSLFERASLNKDQQACSLTLAGMYLVAGFRGYPGLESRLKAAGEDFGRAAALEPDLYKAWAGLALVSSAKRRSMLGALELPGFEFSLPVTCRPRCLSRERLARSAAELPGRGVAPSIVASLVRAGELLPECSESRWPRRAR